MEVVTSIIISNKHSYSITLDLTKENVSAYFNYKKPKREQYYLTHPYNTLEVSTPSRQSVYFDLDFCITFLSNGKELFTFNKGDYNNFSILEDKFNNIYSGNCDNSFMSFVAYKVDKLTYEFAKNVEYIKFDIKDLGGYNRDRLRADDACDFGMCVNQRGISILQVARLLLIERKTIYYCKEFYKPDVSGKTRAISYNDANYYWIKFNNEDKLKVLLAKMNFLNS